uniref:Reverse transcriptase domain-containing protein n=1 Tax=Tanacetum cinerariifolium TaxID=118510 RepID=A0A6L2JLG3_TANCI|nr:hypothetical protein [Tanacetum cinerariifolium]
MLPVTRSIRSTMSLATTRHHHLSRCYLRRCHLSRRRLPHPHIVSTIITTGTTSPPSPPPQHPNHLSTVIITTAAIIHHHHRDSPTSTIYSNSRLHHHRTHPSRRCHSPASSNHRHFYTTIGGVCLAASYRIRGVCLGGSHHQEGVFIWLLLHREMRLDLDSARGVWICYATTIKGCLFRGSAAIKGVCLGMPPKMNSTSAASASEPPAMIQAAVRQLVVDSVATALETQAATMENANNANNVATKSS